MTLKSFSSLTNSELESKSNIIHKLLDQTNDNDKKKSTRRQNDIKSNSNTDDNKSDENARFDSTKEIKEHDERNKANNSSNSTESKGVKLEINKKRRYVLKCWVILC